MAEAGLLREVDLPALEALCTEIAVMREAGAQLERERTRKGALGGGLLSRGAAGQLVRHPLLDVLNSAQGEVRRWAERFGMDPSTRTRLGLLNVKGLTLQQRLAAELGESPRAARPDDVEAP